MIQNISVTFLSEILTHPSTHHEGWGHIGVSISSITPIRSNASFVLLGGMSHIVDIVPLGGISHIFDIVLLGGISHIFDTPHTSRQGVFKQRLSYLA